jgi:GT2 family glycosyltransferase
MPDHEPAASAFHFPSAGREFVGAAQSKLIGSALGIRPIVVRPQKSCDVDWVTGASVMFRSTAVSDSGLFDDGFFLYFEEVELMHRLRKHGWTIRHVPASKVVHMEGAATGVGSGAVTRAFPPYWYRSRRRYFELTGGAFRLIGVNVSSLAGQAITGIKRLVGRPPRNRSYRVSDLLRLGFWPSGARSKPSFPQLGDEPGKPPAWMT